MSATDELRRLLDERGVEWWPMHDVENGYQQDHDTEFLVYGCKHVAHEWGCRLQVDMLTPAQAIAATLGSGTCAFYRPTDLTNGCAALERIAELDADAERGTLTAEQVREAVMSADRWEKPMGDTGLTNTHLIISDDGWQAIADELNATLGSGKCGYIVKDNMNETEGMGDVWFECSACGKQFDYYADEWLTQMPFTPCCGRRVKR